jgi:hypothetical protein
MGFDHGIQQEDSPSKRRILIESQAPLGSLLQDECASQWALWKEELCNHFEEITFIYSWMRCPIII